MNNTFDIRRSINSDTVIGFTSAKTMKSAGFLDSAKVSAYLMDGQESHRKHLGMINLFKTSHNVGVPFMKGLFEDAAVLEVAEGESITYDLPVNNKETKCYTAEDTSDYTDYPGIDGSFFKIILSFEFTKGDILTYDMQYGDQVMVSEEHEVERVGDNFLHYVQLMTNDKNAVYPKEQLKPGIQYMKVGNALGEFTEGFSSLTLMNNPSGSITNEFLLGSPRGIETFHTAKAARMKSDGLNNYADAMRGRIEKKMEALGGKDKNMFVYGKEFMQGGRRVIDPRTAKVGTTLEYLALMELAQMEAYQLLFGKAATIQTNSGVKRTNEGVWHQIRRGKIITYSRPGGITKSHIAEAANYVYGNSDVPPQERRIKFKAGWFAYQNVVGHLFREEAIAQLGALPAGMLGNDKQTNDTVFQGPLNGLEMKPVVITAVTMPGIGKIEIEHDPSLDYQPFSDRLSGGFYGEGFAHTTHSLVIWDATKEEYSNVSSKVKNASLVEGGNSKANIYYVKPEGSHLQYGYHQGRMASADGSPFDIASTMRTMGREFWATSQSGALVLDTTRYVIIELDRNTLNR